MRLREWMKLNRVPAVPLGIKLGLSYPKTIYRYMSLPPRRLPSPAIIAKLEVVSGGKVTLEDFLRPVSEEEKGPFVW
jgi:hypothetical protein